MIIKFSMNRIKNIEKIYCNGIHGRYCGNVYCKQVIEDILGTLKWESQGPYGSPKRLAEECFDINPKEEKNYHIEFEINTYEEKDPRLDCVIEAVDSDEYDQDLERFKIALKNRLLNDWDLCTWLVDMQSVQLCTWAYEKASIIENNLRAFASKVLIHSLGIDWLDNIGLEKEARSVKNLKKEFTQRVRDFENINTDFLSMTLETLKGIMIKGTIYDDQIVLNSVDYEEILKKLQNNKPAISIVDYIKSKRVLKTSIWDKFFVLYIDNPNNFKQALNSFTKDRNHIAHSKILSWKSYDIILKNFEKMNELIRQANEKFDLKEASNETLDTWITLEEAENERNDIEYYDDEQYYRDRLAMETAVEILDKESIKNWFDEILDDLFNDVYRRYNLDERYEISDFQTPDKGICFSVSSSVKEDNSLRVGIVTEIFIDEDLGGNSDCTVFCIDGTGDTICSAKISFSNGDGYENEDCAMMPTGDAIYDISQLPELKEQLFQYIDEELNPYPAQLEEHILENKGENNWTAGCECAECGETGISINSEEFLPFGRCCYCGYDNELKVCEKCHEWFNSEETEGELCPSCSEYIDKL